MEQLSIGEKSLFFDPTTHNLNELTSYLPKDQNTTDPYLDARLQLSKCPYFVFINLATASDLTYLDKIRKVIKFRWRKSNKTYVVFNFTYEDGISQTDFDRLLKITRLVPQERKLVLLNSSAQWQDKGSTKFRHKTQYIDLFAISAVQRELNGMPVCTMPVVEREPNINLLLGRVGKNKRTEVLYEFWKQQLLDNSVMGLLGSSSDLAFNKSLPETIEKLFLEAIEPHWGPADSVSVPDYDPSTSQGYSNDTYKIYNNSCVSYICETWEYTQPMQHTFITEKTYRAILNRSPFVIQGTNGILHDLKTKGFHTFEKFIKENYQGNVRATVEAANKLREMVKLYPEEIQEIVDHNYRVLHKINRKQIQQMNRAFAELKDN
jgi:hypothetical protein|tara:strand:- start:5533 stop:6666 length:1134 start_codon:yes stop_codon:yes gene_type:complete